MKVKYYIKMTVMSHFKICVEITGDDSNFTTHTT